MSEHTDNAFLTTLQELEGGTLMADLHKKLTELVGDVRSVNKAGSLQLTIKVKPAANGTGALLLEDDIKINAPKPARDATIMFAADDNTLSRRDPRQPRLPGTEPRRQFPVAVNQSTGEVIE